MFSEKAHSFNANRSAVEAFLLVLDAFLQLMGNLDANDTI